MRRVFWFFAGESQVSFTCHDLSYFVRRFDGQLSCDSLSLPTVIQQTLKIGHKYSTVPLAQEQASERASERLSAAERVSEAGSAE